MFLKTLIFFLSKKQKAYKRINEMLNIKIVKETDTDEWLFGLLGKKDTKMERKMGHITAVDKSLEKAYKKAKLARKLISI